MTFNNQTLKFLIDSGSNKSFINPSLVDSNCVRKIKPLILKTVFATHALDSEIEIPSFKEFNNNINLTFLLFKFHNYFDGLIGLDTLTTLKVKINFQNSILESDLFKIPIQFKPNYISKKYIVPPKSKMLVCLPVDVKEGDIFIKPVSINKNVEVSEGIYKSRNWYALVEITNYSDEEENILLEQPIKVIPLKSQVYEIHNFSITLTVTTYLNILTKHFL